MRTAAHAIVEQLVALGADLVGDRNAEASYGLQLRRRFPDSKEALALKSGNYQ